VSSLAELRRIELEVVGRFAGDQGASQLFVVDPVRALEMVSVALTADAVREWEAASPGLAGRDPTGRFDRLRDLGPDPDLTVNVQGLLPPPGMDLVAEDTATWRELLGYTDGQAGP
jgi:hypothetical protein